jgi:hypothetical protein
VPASPAYEIRELGARLAVGTRAANPECMTSVLTVAAVLVATTGIAAAGPYVGLAIGPSPSLGNDLGLVTEGRTGRLLGGYRLGRLSAEAAITANNVTYLNSNVDFNARHLSIAGKYNHPLGDRFEAFGKLGLQYSSYASDVTPSLTGGDWLLGVGAEYRINIGIAAASVFLVVEYTKIQLAQDAGPTNDVRSLQPMLGFSIGM